MKNTGSIRTKLISIIGLSVLVPIIIVIIISSLKLRDDAIILAKTNAKTNAEIYSKGIGQDLNQVFKALNTFTDILSSTMDENGVSNFDLEQIHQMENKFLIENKQVLTVFLNFLPNHFNKIDNSGTNETLTSFKYINKKGVYSYLDRWNYNFKSDVVSYLKQHNGQIFTEPYKDFLEGDSLLMISYGKAIYSNNEISGVLGVDISIDWIQNYISNTELFNGAAQIFIVSDGGIINADNKNKANVGKNITDIINGYQKDDLFENFNEIEVLEEGDFKFTVPVNFEGVDKAWYVIIKVPEKSVLKDTNWLLGKRIGLVSLILLLALSIAYIYTNKIITRIFKLSKIAEKVAQGNLDVSFEVVGNDEIEDLSQSLQTMVDKFFEIIKNIKKTTEDLYKSGNALSETAIKLSEGASEQASSTEEVSASMEQLNANIEQNAENSKLADAMAQKSATGIEISSKNVIATTSAMGDIAKKISIIGDIAFQTNILALNASVEAARAGQYGKGFGVVAKEVGKLADNSKVAAADINDITSKSFISAKKSGELLDQIVPDIKKTALLVQEITNASLEQRAGTDQINNALQQLNNVTQQNAASAEQLAMNVEALNSYADELTKLIGFFNLDKENNEKENNDFAQNEDDIDNSNYKYKEEINDFSDFESDMKEIEDDNEYDEKLEQKENKDFKIDFESKIEKKISKTQEILPKEPKDIKRGFNFNLGNEDSDDEFEKF
ncbi:MAG: HAMP domain-containing protein [Bacteroidales bacterium]|nr:HAMP domain-containing protein [Bacteroidales bacterium]MBN2758091.1 HAMP domain-containing protein [Bacteroidales bacterium]